MATVVTDDIALQNELDPRALHAKSATSFKANAGCLDRTESPEKDDLRSLHDLAFYVVAGLLLKKQADCCNRATPLSACSCMLSPY